MFALSDPNSVSMLMPWTKRQLFRNPAWRRELRRRHPEFCIADPTPRRCTAERVFGKWPPYEAWEEKPEPLKLDGCIESRPFHRSHRRTMTANEPPKPSTASKVFGIVACALAVAGLVLPLPGFWELYNIPVGTECRPMGQAFSIFLFGLGTPSVVLPFAIVAMAERGTSRKLGLVAVALSLLPLPIFNFLFGWIMNAHALIPLP